MKIKRLAAWILFAPLFSVFGIFALLMMKSSRSNCAIFAIQRLIERGGYLCIRQSRFGWWPHFVWAPTLDEVSGLQNYVPIKRNESFKYIEKFIFVGHVVDHDEGLVDELDLDKMNNRETKWK